MQYTSAFQSPLGEILLACDEAGLTGLWFQGAKYFAKGLSPQRREEETPLLTQAKRWLEDYFSGREPDFTPPLRLTGTPFQRSIWELLRRIPYGTTTTYGELARRAAADRGLPRMSPQAVGGAVGRNPISILIPCHRVLGSGGALTGYAGGLEKKLQLLTLEGIPVQPQRRLRSLVSHPAVGLRPNPPGLCPGPAAL